MKHRITIETEELEVLKGALEAFTDKTIEALTCPPSKDSEKAYIDRALQVGVILKLRQKLNKITTSAAQP